MDFNIPHRLRKFDEHNIVVLQLIFDYIQSKLRGYPVRVTYTTNMDTDVKGNSGDIVFCTTDSTFYGCTVSGDVGSATWVALH